MPKPWLDEDWGYEDFRQSRKDEEAGERSNPAPRPVKPSRSPLSSPPILGSALPAAERVQRFARTDPNPAVPFTSPEPPLRFQDLTWLDILYGVSVVGTLGYAVYIIYK